MTHHWLTEYVAKGSGDRYAGPLIVADSEATARAILETSVRGPSGEPLRVLGEFLLEIPVSTETAPDPARKAN